MRLIRHIRLGYGLANEALHRVSVIRQISHTPIVCLETALPVKFADTMREALGEEPETPERFADIMQGGRHVADLPNDANAVKGFIRESIAKSDVTN